MEFLGWLLFIAVGFFIASNLYKSSDAVKSKSTRHCLTCGIEGTPKSVVKGSIAIEIILWICFIVPGLIYSFWRMSSRAGICSACGSTALVPVDSPSALAHRKSLQA